MGLTRAQRQPYRQTIAIDHRMDFAGQAAAGPSHRLALVPCDARSMLMHADNGGVDHLDSGILGSGKRVYNAAPDTSPLSPNEAVIAWCMGQMPPTDRARVLRIARPRKCHRRHGDGLPEE